MSSSQRHQTAPSSPEEFFAGSPTGLAICRAVQAMVEGLGGGTEMRVSKSQVAFRRRRGFAYVWRPDRYLKSDVPAVLSLATDHPIASQRFKEVVHPSPRVWMHHLELRDPTEVDSEVEQWLRLCAAAAA
ncbi:MAG TPA: DUF5655 domain-containing protein [Dermatophilaceae bacterium]|nr:DUF5655 domain-containing protein [Dermatophilaceae bacterium]